MPNFRGPGIPFLNKQPWLLSSPPQDGPPYIPNFPTGTFEQISRTPRAALTAKSFRAPPVLAAAAATFSPAPIAVALAAQRQLPVGKGRVRAPLLFYTPPRFRTQLTARPWWLKTTAKLRPPVVLGYYQAKPRVQLAYWRPPPAGRSTLKPPTVVTAAAVFAPAPPKLELARRAWAIQPTRNQLRPPTVVVPATVVTVPYRVKLAAAPPRPARYTLRAPTVVIPTPTVPFRVKLALPLPPQLRPAHPQFRAPAVAGPFATTTLQQRTPSIRLAQRQWQVQPTRSSLRPPTVVTPFVPPTVTVQGGTDWAASIASSY